VPDPISYQLDGAIARIAFDDGKANATSVTCFEALGAALDRAESDGASGALLRGRT